MSEPINATILCGNGINCERESRAALEMAGAHVTLMRMNDFASGQADLSDCDLLLFPGGFSFGDDLGAGRVMAAKVRHLCNPDGMSFLDAIHAHLATGGYVMGICNGFQILAALDLLPGSLLPNDCGHFQDRWVRCRVPEQCACPLLPAGAVLDLPIRHGEGRVALDHEDAAAGIALEYVDGNPNGSDRLCAALTDPTGHILGMMPHPEAYLHTTNHPEWTRNGQDLLTGRHLFQHIIRTLQQERSLCLTT